MFEEKNLNQPTDGQYRQKAMEHDIADLPGVDPKEAAETIENAVAGGYQKIETAVVDGYQKIENAVVGGYKKIETGVVEGFSKMTDHFVEKFFTREGETVEEAKKRMQPSSDK